jgi:hypothetical protein
MGEFHVVDYFAFLHEYKAVIVGQDYVLGGAGIFFYLFAFYQAADVYGRFFAFNKSNERIKQRFVILVHEEIGSSVHIGAVLRLVLGYHVQILILHGFYEFLELRAIKQLTLVRIFLEEVNIFLQYVGGNLHEQRYKIYFAALFMEKLQGEMATPQDLVRLFTRMTDTWMNKLQENIDAEAQAREEADIDLQTNITAEATARADADVVLQDNITAEETARIAADDVLQQNIDAEEATRTSEDAALQADITAEATARADADVVLQDNITAEEAARIAADNAIEAKLNNDVVASVTAYASPTNVRLQFSLVNISTGATSVFDVQIPEVNTTNAGIIAPALLTSLSGALARTSTIPAAPTAAGTYKLSVDASGTASWIAG